MVSLLIFVLSAQFAFAENIISSLWDSTKNVGETVAGLKAMFSVEGIADIFIRLVNFVVDSVFGIFLKVSGWVFDWSLDLVMNADTSVVKSGWSKSLSVANNLFILILLGIAIGTILGLPTFNYKTMLPKFLMVALLINFSLAIGNVIIGTTNVFANKFYSDIKGNISNISEIFVNNANVVKPIEKAAEDIKNKTDSGENLKSITDQAPSFIFVFIYKIFTYSVAIFMFLAGAVYMITRTFYLWLLLMLAPLAWISLLIPGLQQQWKLWWEKFIKWSIFAPAYLFFLWLGVEISRNSAIRGFVSAHASYNNSFTDIAGYIVQMLAVAFIMISGLMVSDKLGIGGSNFVINYGNNLRKAAGKKFKDMRGKSEWSAEAVGKRFGAIGARMTAPFGVTEGGKRVQERYAVERLEMEEKERKKEQVGGLYNLRGQLENIKKFERESLAFAIESGLSKEQLKEYREQLKNRRLQILRDIRAAAGEGKDLKKEIEKLAKEAGVIEEGKTEKSTEGEKKGSDKNK